MTSGAKRRPFRALFVAIVLLPVVSGAAWALGRHALAASILAGELEEHGLRCGPLHVHLDFWLDQLEIAETECTPVEASAVETIRFGAPAIIDLESLTPVAIRTDEVTIDLEAGGAPSAIDPAVFAGALASLASVREQILALLRGGTGLATTGVPRFEARLVTVRRNGVPIARLEDVSGGGESDRLPIHAAAVTLVDAEVPIEGLDAELTPDSASVTATVELSAGTSLVRLHHPVRLRLRASQLDEAAPELEVSAGTRI